MRRRIVVGYVGEDGIEANTWYRCDSGGRLVVAPDDEYDPFTAPDCAADARGVNQ